MFNDLVLYLIPPLILFGILRALIRLVRGEEDTNRQLMVIMGIIFGGLTSSILAALNRQFIHFDHWSFDPLAFILPRNAIIALLIAVSALVTVLLLAGIEVLQQRGEGPYAAATYAAIFIFIIYLAYFNLALDAVAAIAILGVLVGIGLWKIVQRWV